MRHAIVISLFAVACHQAGADQPLKTDPGPQPTPFSDRAALLSPIQVDSLTLTPIVAAGASAPEEVDVVTLDEAFKQKLVAIKEKEDETVNQLTLTNKADRPMFLLAGEVIIGGKQDRIIGQNTIIAANQTHVVPVFCVEHGRWSEGETGRVFTSGEALAHGRLRAQASFKGQSEVWAEVSRKNRQLEVRNSTDTYRNVASKQSTGALGYQEKQINLAISRVTPTDRANMIGFVVALNGKIATVDMFNSPRLYRKLETKLLRSYLTEALEVPAAKDIKPPTVADVKSFVADADKAKEQPSYDTDLAETVKSDGDRAAKSQVIYKPSKTSKGGAYEGKMGKPAPLYESYQSKQ